MEYKYRMKRSASRRSLRSKVSNKPEESSISCKASNGDSTMPVNYYDLLLIGGEFRGRPLGGLQHYNNIVIPIIT